GEAPATARDWPSGWKPSQRTRPPNPESDATWRWLATSHSQTSPDSRPAARVLPSGLKATAQAHKLSPAEKLNSKSPVATFQTLRVAPRFSPADARSVPSGEKAI